MGWKIENGAMVRVGPAPQEITVQPEITDELVCPECGREYKTESGLTRHISDKH